MKKVLIVLIILFTASVFFADGGTFQKKRVSRFLPGKDSLGADVPKEILAFFPADSKSKYAVHMDAGMYKMAELRWMVPLKGVKEPASDYASVMGRFVKLSADNEMFVKMQLDGVDQSRIPEIEKEVKHQYQSTIMPGYSTMRVFSKGESVKSKKFPGAGIWLQKWETTDDSPKQTWYDCYYYMKGKANVAELWVCAVPDIETADKYFAEFLAKVNKK